MIVEITRAVCSYFIIYNFIVVKSTLKYTQARNEEYEEYLYMQEFSCTPSRITSAIVAVNMYSHFINFAYTACNFAFLFSVIRLWKIAFEPFWRLHCIECSRISMKGSCML